MYLHETAIVIFRRLQAFKEQGTLLSLLILKHNEVFTLYRIFVENFIFLVIHNLYISDHVLQSGLSA